MGLQDVSAMELRFGEIGNLFESPELQHAFQACREVVLEAFDANFRSSSSPDSGAWPPRQDSLPHPLLIKTGGLRKAATGKGPGHVTIWLKDGFQVGVDSSVGVGGVPAAAAHNFGSGFLPKREFMAVPSTTNTECRQLIIDALQEMLDG